MADFVANFFELWGIAYLGPFSQYMYKADLYFVPFLWLLFLPLIVLFVYYKLWDNIRLAKTWIQGGRIKMRSPPKVLTGNFRPSQLSFFLS